MFAEIDIVIVNYNSTDYLLACLDSIFKNRDGLRINLFVTDNHSNDHPERIPAAYPEVAYIAHGRNFGFAKAINGMLTQCRSSWIFLINPDTVIQKGFFTTILRYAEDHPKIGILGPKTLNPDSSIQGSARAFPGVFTALFGRTSLLSKIFPRNRLTLKNIITMQQNHEESVSVDWVSGGCMAVNQTAMRKVGLLDERFFMYWEDADWCRRMHENGFDVVYFPKAEIVHIGGQSSNSNFIRSRYEFHKSSYRLYFKYASSGSIMKFAAALGLAARFFCVTFFNIRWIKIAVRKARPGAGG